MPGRNELRLTRIWPSVSRWPIRLQPRPLNDRAVDSHQASAAKTPPPHGALDARALFPLFWNHGIIRSSRGPFGARTGVTPFDLQAARRGGTRRRVRRPHRRSAAGSAGNAFLPSLAPDARGTRPEPPGGALYLLLGGFPEHERARRLSHRELL